MTNLEIIGKRLEKELNEYFKELESKTAEELIDLSYEITFKKEIVALFHTEVLGFEDDEYFELAQLNEKASLLDTLYFEYIRSDYDGDEALCLSMEDFIRDVNK